MIAGKSYIDARFGLQWKCLKAYADGGFRVQLDKENGPIIEHRPSGGNICSIEFKPVPEKGKDQ